MTKRMWKLTVTTFYRLVFVLVMLVGIAWAIELTGVDVVGIIQRQP